MMRIAMVADGRAENFLRWLSYFSTTHDEILILSTFPCSQEGIRHKVKVLPSILKPSDVLLKRSDKSSVRKGIKLGQWLLKTGLGQKLDPVWQQVRLINLIPHIFVTRKEIDAFKPDVTLSFRTQSEGYIGGLSGFHPWALFVQGQDFINLANRFWIHERLTKQVLPKCDALFADCQRDILLGKKMGLPASSPTWQFPGNGGVDLDIFTPGPSASARERLVVYPRGMSPYLRLDTLFKAIKILDGRSNWMPARFILLMPFPVVSMVEEMVQKAGLNSEWVQVLPFMDKYALSSLLRRTAVLVSPSISDGTPNSMLEAMASGVFPIMGRLDSIEEWIQQGKNGLLFNVEDPIQLADFIEEALNNRTLCQHAQEQNLDLIRSRADFKQTMPQMRELLLSLSKN
jgi:glycosyltransferase involved in cell wall biosynthesis